MPVCVLVGVAALEGVGTRVRVSLGVGVSEAVAVAKVVSEGVGGVVFDAGERVCEGVPGHSKSSQPPV